jgi:hypothetical protein
MSLDDFDAREPQLLRDRKPLWTERWREKHGAVTAVRFSPRVTLIVFGGMLSNEGAEWIEPLLPRLFEGREQLHFIDQGSLDAPNSKVRQVYMGALVQRRADLARIHMYMSGNAVLRMIASAANVVLGGLGEFHGDRASFDRALAEQLTAPHESVTASQTIKASTSNTANRRGSK